MEQADLEIPEAMQKVKEFCKTMGYCKDCVFSVEADGGHYCVFSTIPSTWKIDKIKWNNREQTI